MQQWACTDALLELNKDKIREISQAVPGFKMATYWHYQVFMHRCGFHGVLDDDDKRELLRMLEGPQYDENAFVAVETSLSRLIHSLILDLETNNPSIYFQRVDEWNQIADQMKRARDSSHGSRLPNEYIAYSKTMGK